MKTLSIQLLGTVDIRLGEQPVTGFVSNKAQALLLYLAVTQRPITRTALATLLWGDWGETAARRSLSKALSNLRQLVGDHLKIERHTVVFQAERAHWLDVATFEEILDSTEFAQPDGEMADRAVEALQKAVALYQGEFLAGFYVDNAPDFEVWARAERERLYHLYYKALIRLINLTERAADLSQAIGYTQQLLHLEPTDEDAHRRLMALYMRNGQRSRALAQYKVCREILANELNVEPAAETSSLYRAIRQGDTAPHHTTFATAIDESATAISSLPPQQTNTAHLLPSMHPRPEFPLIGRTAHWQHLLTIWQQTRTGRPHVCLIRGEAGIGKTRLAEELLQWVAKRGGAVARTRAYGAAGELAYAPIIDWLRSATLQTALATLDPIWLTEIARLLPELTTVHPPQQSGTSWSPSPGDHQWQRQRLFDALSKVFQTGTTPKVLLLDDMQWCDQETLAWLHYFLQANRSAHRAVKPAAPLLILATARPEILQEAHPFMPVLLHLRSDEVMTEIDLEPLDDATTAALAQQVSPQPLTPAQNARLYRYTEGNPLFVIETLRTTAWQKDSVVPELSRQIEHRPHSSQAGGETGQLKLSGKVQAVIQERLSQLSPTSYRLARLASVIGRSFQFTVLQQASDEEEEVVTEGLNELWQQGIVRALGNQQYDFSHDRIREVAYLTVGPVQRPLWHRRVAKALEESNKTDLMPLNVQLASHYEQAGDIARAIDYLQQAAERAEALFAVGDAVNLLNQALTLVQTLPVNRGNKEIELRILLQLKEPLVAAQGYFEPALGEIGLHAKTLAEEVGETDQLIQALTCLHNYHQMRAEYQAARSVAEQMVNLVDRLYREPAQLKTEAAQSFARAHNALAHTLLHCGELVSARQHFEKALEFKSGSIQPFAFMAMTMWLLGYPDRARQYAYQTIAIARRRSQPMLMAFATNNIARVHHFMHNSQSMKQLTETSLALAGKYHIPFFLLLNRLFQGRILAEEGQTEEGIAQIRAMLAQLDQKNHAAFRTWFLTLLAESYACAHQFTDALETLDQALVLVERNGERFWHAELVRLQGDYRWTLGASLAAVESCYVEAIAIAQTQQAKSLQLRATVSLARLWLQEGKQKAAHTRLSEIYNWFTEGFNTADLRAARAMLAELQ